MKTIIVAMDTNGAIGFNNDLPWGRGLKDDLAHFKKATQRSSIIMGRRTFESIGSQPLPNRENIVIASRPTGVKGVLSAASLDAAYALARYPIMIIGGAQVYASALDTADVLLVTHVQESFDDASVYFPEIDWSEWREVSRDHYDADARNSHTFDIVCYHRVA